MRYVLALEGTTSSRAILFDEEARAVASAQREFRQIFPQPGWVEHDPKEIFATQRETARERCATSICHGGGHHESAGNDDCLGSPDRRADPQRHRVAGPTHRAVVCGAGKAGAERLIRTHGPGHRSVLQRHQDRMATRQRARRAGARRARRARVRHRRHVAHLAAHRESHACHRRLERLAHPAFNILENDWDPELLQLLECRAPSCRTCIRPRTRSACCPRRFSASRW